MASLARVGVMEAEAHVPVLVQEVVAGLGPRPAGNYIDCTVGTGGHAAAILDAAGLGARLLGIDADPEALDRAREVLQRFGDRVVLREANFRYLGPIAESAGFAAADGVLVDLGMSSLQLDAGARGFSFGDEGPLDMRFSPRQHVTAADLLNSCPEQALADLIYRFGEEPAARRIARFIVAHRPILTAAHLADVVAAAVRRRGKTHPATRTFQAIRIAVNDELAALDELLPQALQVLASGGRLAVISFHSLEDRAVKRFSQTESRDCICPPQAPQCVCGHRARVRLVHRRPIRPSIVEVEGNPRSRSATLRVAEKL